MPELERLGRKFIAQRAPSDSFPLPRYGIPRSLGDVYLKSLARLTLVHVDVPEAVLTTFLSKHSKTLRWLRLLDIQLLAPGRWRPVLQLLQENAIVLEGIRFEQLTQSRALLAPSKGMMPGFRG
jgi:hypothetical protein